MMFSFTFYLKYIYVGIFFLQIYLYAYNEILIYSAQHHLYNLYYMLNARFFFSLNGILNSGSNECSKINVVS